MTSKEGFTVFVRQCIITHALQIKLFSGLEAAQDYALARWKIPHRAWEQVTFNTKAICVGWQYWKDETELLTIELHTVEELPESSSACGACGGRGRVTENVERKLNQIGKVGYSVKQTISKDCPYCNGTGMRPIPEPENPGKKFVLVYRHEATVGYFRSQNLFLKGAELSDNLEQAAIMTLDEAESKWNCMNEKSKWEIWSITCGRMLDRISERHAIRARRRELERLLSELPKEE